MYINIHENFLLTRRKYITIVKRQVFLDYAKYQHNIFAFAT